MSEGIIIGIVFPFIKNNLYNIIVNILDLVYYLYLNSNFYDYIFIGLGLIPLPTQTYVLDGYEYIKYNTRGPCLIYRLYARTILCLHIILDFLNIPLCYEPIYYYYPWIIL